MTEYPIHNHIHRGPSRRGVCPACDMMGSNYPFLLNANERLMAVTLEANELRAKLDAVITLAAEWATIEEPSEYGHPRKYQQKLDGNHILYLLGEPQRWDE